MIILTLARPTSRLLLILSGFLLLMNTSAQPGQPDSLKTRLNQILDQWHRDASEGNHAAYLGAMGNDGVYIGTDASENWSTAEFRKWSKPFFDRQRTWSFKTITRNIYLNHGGTIAWFDELLETQMGLCRGSGVLQKRDSTWKIEQYVLSATIPNGMMRTVTGLKRNSDSLVIPYLKNGIKDVEKSMGLKSVFDKYAMNGTILIFDPATGEYAGYDPARWDSGYLPASTFKIPNLLIGLETGVIDTAFVFRWNGDKRRMPQWEKDLSLPEAFRLSCVPCFQELARKIGPDRMKSHLIKMNYPGMDVQKENIDLFWLEGNSRITPRQQVEFLRRLYEEKLPLKTSVMQEAKNIMVQETTPGYKLSGKTGWAIRNGNNYGWFVGWIETQGRVSFVATLVEAKNQEKVDDFAMARKAVTMEALRWMGIIK
jgi:beta-lactamase class D